MEPALTLALVSCGIFFFTGLTWPLSNSTKECGCAVVVADYCDYWSHPHPVVRKLESAVPEFRKGISLLIRNA